MSHFVQSKCGYARLIWNEKTQIIEVDHPVNKSTLISMNEIPIQSIKFGKEGNEDNISYYTITYTDGCSRVKTIIDLD